MREWITTIGLACLCGLAAAQCEPSSVGGLVGGVADADVVDGVAYLAAGRGGVHVVDVSDPTNMELIGVVVDADVVDVQAQGEWLFIAARQQGLIIADITDPLSPLVVSSLDVGGQVRDLCVSAGHAFMVVDDGMVIVDILDPLSPDVVGEYATQRLALELIDDGDVVYLSVVDEGLHVLDVSDPSAPMRLTKLGPFPEIRGMDIVGERLYFAAHDEGLGIADISDPASARVIAVVDMIFPDVHDVRIQGDLAFLGVDSGLLIIDIADAPDRDFVGLINFGDGGTEHIQLAGDLIFMTAGAGGFRTVDVSDVTEPVELDRIRSPYFTRDLAIANGVAYVLDTGGLVDVVLTIDISDPTFPRFLGETHFGGDLDVIKVDGGRGLVYIADSDRGLRILDVSEPSEPTLITTFEMPDRARELEVSGEIVFVTDFDGGTFTIDVSDPLKPQVAGRVDSGGPMRLLGDLLFQSRAGLAIWDAADPSDLRLVGELDLHGHTAGIDAIENWAFVIVDAGDPFRDRPPAEGLYIIDVADPSTPTLVSYIAIPRFQEGERDHGELAWVRVHESVAYIGYDEFGVSMFDVSNPRLPRVIGNYQLNRQPNSGLVIDGGLGFVANSFSGMSVIDVSGCRGCAADVDRDGDADAEDFFAFLEAFARGDAWICDVDGNGECNSEDFFRFLDFFAAGCS